MDAKPSILDSFLQRLSPHNQKRVLLAIWKMPRELDVRGYKLKGNDLVCEYNFHSHVSVTEPREMTIPLSS